MSLTRNIAGKEMKKLEIKTLSPNKNHYNNLNVNKNLFKFHCLNLKTKFNPRN
jgi:hypothetical protein